MPIAINPICRKPRMLLKFNNSYLRRLNKEILCEENYLIGENIRKASEPKIILCGKQNAEDERIRLSLLARLNIGKSLPIFLNK